MTLRALLTPCFPYFGFCLSVIQEGPLCVRAQRTGSTDSSVTTELSAALAGLAPRLEHRPSDGFNSSQWHVPRL